MPGIVLPEGMYLIVCDEAYVLTPSAGTWSWVGVLEVNRKNVSPPQRYRLFLFLSPL